MHRHQKRAFLLIYVLLLMSLAVMVEVLTTRHLVNLRRHVNHRQQLIQNRVSSTDTLAQRIIKK